MIKKNKQINWLFLPLFLWVVIVPIIVKVKILPNPLSNYAWYNSAESLFDFFLYYKSQVVTFLGLLMLLILCWQFSKMRHKEYLLHRDYHIFVPLVIYLLFVIISSAFSQYNRFCTQGMPDQYETVWNLISYITVTIYACWLTVEQNGERKILFALYTGATLVGLICVLQFLKIDIYRIIYAKDNYSFIFPLGTVYGSFYNINYVGYYVMLLLPLFVLMTFLCHDIKVRIISVALTVCMLISIYGAQSSTGMIAMFIVVFFTVLFLLIKNIREKRWLMIPLVAIILGSICLFIAAIPYIHQYVRASDTEQSRTQNIYTNDDNVEIIYEGQKLFISMNISDDLYSFNVTDQNQNILNTTFCPSDEGYYFTIDDKRFTGITITPALISEDPEIYGFMVYINDRNWVFSNQASDDGTYYYYSSMGSMTKIVKENQSADFRPLVHASSIASGRGYIWNKTIAILKNYIFLGSGADTFALVFPNDDYVDKYNNGYDNMVITKPHNLYLQIAVQSGVISLICFLIFYLWYFIASFRIYLKQKLDNNLTITGFAIMLGTLGYMISGLANDSTITVAPLYWAMLGIGIGINQRIRSAQS